MSAVSVGSVAVDIDIGIIILDEADVPGLEIFSSVVVSDVVTDGADVDDCASVHVGSVILDLAGVEKFRSVRIVVPA